MPSDSEDERIRKGALVLASGIISALSPVWVITYLLLDLPLSAAEARCHHQHRRGTS